MDNTVLYIQKKEPTDKIIALIGNPNVGKSTLFNAMTGMNQHTGNWPGKTVAVAQGRYEYKGKGYILVDLPGTYSLLTQSEEEQIAVDFLLSGQADCVLVVADATSLERSLAFLFQVMEFQIKPIFCVNLMDQAEKKGIRLDLSVLTQRLGIPVIGTSAGRNDGIGELKEILRNLNDGFLAVHPNVCGISLPDLLQDKNHSMWDQAADILYSTAEKVEREVVLSEEATGMHWFDRIAIGRISGRILLLLVLFLIFWITISGANYPSAMLERAFEWIYGQLNQATKSWPSWISGLLLDGIYGTTSKVISVMLPPIMIFFPLFTLLEDLGYLPRAAYMMDHCFQACGTCGKQVLTMSLGFGCNAAGVMGCRIISSPRDRLIAILTNALVPCNGKFPAMITLIALFFSQKSVYGAIILTLFVLIGILATCLSSKLLSSVLPEQHSSFILELPSYRRPQWKKILIRSFLDRIVFVLGRAAAVAAPAGALIWCMHTVSINGIPFLQLISSCLDPIGHFLGMNGAVFLAFILAFPANELFLPCIVMLLSNGSFINQTSGMNLEELLTTNGWTIRTVICVLLFILFHWPCSTTCLTIKKELGSWKWTLAAILLPSTIGILLCSLIASL